MRRKMSAAERERYYFEMFRRDYRLPDGAIRYQDSPDVVLTGDRKIGIEVTNFFREDGKDPSCEQAQVPLRETVVLDAQKSYLRGGGRRIELSFSFDPARPIGSQAALVRRIVRFATKIDGRADGTVGKDLYHDIPEVNFVYLNSTEYPGARWRVVQGHSGRPVSMPQLSKIIRTKEAKSRHYENCDAYWLLVVIDFMDLAQDQEVPMERIEGVESTAFEKVLVYRTCFGHVFEAKR